MGDLENMLPGYAQLDLDSEVTCVIPFGASIKGIVKNVGAVK